MMFLVETKLRRFGEGNDDNRDAAAVEFTFQGLHLAEVLLARESGQVPEKNEQSVVLEVIAQGDLFATEIMKTEIMDGEIFHCSG